MTGTSARAAHPLRARFSRHLLATGLLDDTRLVIAAVSGGADSTALLYLLDPVCRERGITLVGCHVAHGIRPRTGNLDARAAADHAAALGLSFALRPFSALELRKHGESLEAAARRIRYESFLALRGELGPGAVVATGHTRNDQAETVLLNLERHLGRSRGGIRERRADGVIRPLLPFSRNELRHFLATEGLSFREDESNLERRFARNRIRLDVLPALEARWPGITERLARAGGAYTARIERQDAALESLLAAAGTTFAGPFPRQAFRELPEELLGRLLVRAAGTRGKVPGRSQIFKVLSRLRGGQPGVRESLGGLRIAATSRLVRLA